MNATALQAIPQPIDELDEALERWGAYERWFRRKKCCGSIEGGWRSPQRWDAPPVSSPSKANVEEAAIIREAIQLVQIDHAILLTAWYVDCSKPRILFALAAKCGFVDPTMSDVSIALSNGRKQLAKALEVPAVIRKLRVRNRIQRILQTGIYTALSFA